MRTLPDDTRTILPGEWFWIQQGQPFTGRTHRTRWKGRVVIALAVTLYLTATITLITYLKGWTT